MYSSSRPRARGEETTARRPRGDRCSPPPSSTRARPSPQRLGARQPDRCSPAAIPPEEEASRYSVVESRSAMKRGARRPSCMVARPLAEEELVARHARPSPIAMLHATTRCSMKSRHARRSMMVARRKGSPRAHRRRAGRSAARPAACSVTGALPRSPLRCFHGEEPSLAREKEYAAIAARETPHRSRQG
ncbi:hypothetical protein Dimus_035615, partial [Dionaea muscipula]